MEEMTNGYNVLVGEPKPRDHLEDLGVDERIILELILGIWHGSIWTGFVWRRIFVNGGPFR